MKITVCDVCDNRMENEPLSVGPEVSGGFHQYEVRLKPRMLIERQDGAGMPRYSDIDMCWVCFDRLRMEPS